MCTWADPPEIYRDSTHAARKQHQCAECARKIEPGERYHYAFMVSEGFADYFRTCAHCRVGHQWLLKNCNSFMHAGLRDEMQEHAEEYPAIRFGLLRIEVGMRRQWRRFDGNGLMNLPPMPRPIESAVLEAA